IFVIDELGILDGQIAAFRAYAGSIAIRDPRALEGDVAYRDTVAVDHEQGLARADFVRQHDVGADAFDREIVLRDDGAIEILTGVDPHRIAARCRGDRLTWLFVLFGWSDLQDAGGRWACATDRGDEKHQSRPDHATISFWVGCSRSRTEGSP